jgi:hypothetical protein
MSGIRDLVRGTEKVIGHYRLLLSIKAEERELYGSRFDRERRLLNKLHGGLPDGVRGVTSRTGDDRFAAFDIVLKRRGRSRWKWSVRATNGRDVMYGSECSRGGARYKSERALFLLLCARASRLPKLPLEPSDLVRRTPCRSKDTGTSEIYLTLDALGDGP